MHGKGTTCDLLSIGEQCKSYLEEPPDESDCMQFPNIAEPAADDHKMRMMINTSTSEDGDEELMCAIPSTRGKAFERRERRRRSVNAKQYVCNQTELTQGQLSKGIVPCTPA